MKAGLVSVMMPAYNAEAFIGEALGSLARQEYSDWELIVINQGSTDGSPEVLGRYQTMAHAVPAGPVMAWLTERVLGLRTGTAIGRQEIETIAQVLQLCWQDGEAGRAWLGVWPTLPSPAEKPIGVASRRSG